MATIQTKIAHADQRSNLFHGDIFTAPVHTRRSITAVEGSAKIIQHYQLKILQDAIKAHYSYAISELLEAFIATAEEIRNIGSVSGAERAVAIIENLVGATEQNAKDYAALTTNSGPVILALEFERTVVDALNRLNEAVEASSFRQSSYGRARAQIAAWN